jgi:hypothetical protein
VCSWKNFKSESQHTKTKDGREKCSACQELNLFHPTLGNNFRFELPGHLGKLCVLPFFPQKFTTPVL